MSNSLKWRIKFIVSFLLVIEISIATCVSENLTVEQALEKREKIIAYAKTYIGSPYSSGAVGPNYFDCSGFIYFIARESAKIQLPRSAKAMYKFVTQIDDSEIEPGDLLFFSAVEGVITHVSLYIGDDKIIHSASEGPKTGVIISSRNERYWKTHYVGAGRFIPSAKGLVADSRVEEKEQTDSTKDTNVSKTDTTIKEDNKIIIAKDTTSKNTNASSNAKSNSFVNNLVCNFSLSVDWALRKSNEWNPNFRGISSEANITYSRFFIKPGIGSAIRWNYGVSAFQLPFLLILGIGDYWRFYVGPNFTLGSPSYLGTSEKLSVMILPGIIGVSVCTPAINSGKISVSFVQDLSFSTYKKSDGSFLDAGKAASVGFMLSTGIKISFPLRS